jgi:hypothetical protein
MNAKKINANVVSKSTTESTKKATAKTAAKNKKNGTTAAKARAKTESTKKALSNKSATVLERRMFLFNLIKTAKHSYDEVLAMMKSNFTNVTESTLRTELTDSKNPKYSDFERQVTVTENGKLVFAKAKIENSYHQKLRNNIKAFLAEKKLSY